MIAKRKILPIALLAIIFVLLIFFSKNRSKTITHGSKLEYVTQFTAGEMPFGVNVVDYLEKISIKPKSGILSYEQLIQLNGMLMQVIVHEYSNGNACVKIKSDCDIYIVLDNTFCKNISWLSISLQDIHLKKIDVSALVAYIDARLFYYEECERGMNRQNR